MVLAIEPMLNAGAGAVRMLDDGWTVVTADASLSARVEHTVAITSGGPRILTADRDGRRAARPPTITIIRLLPNAQSSTRIEKLEGENYRLTGELTIRDVTRPIALEAEYGGRGKDPWGNERVGFTAKGALHRKDFGLKWNQALEAGGVLVSDRVDIELEVQAVRAAASAAA